MDTRESPSRRSLKRRKSVSAGKRKARKKLKNNNPYRGISLRSDDPLSDNTLGKRSFSTDNSDSEASSEAYISLRRMTKLGFAAYRSPRRMTKLGFAALRSDDPLSDDTLGKRSFSTDDSDSEASSEAYISPRRMTKLGFAALRSDDPLSDDTLFAPLFAVKKSDTTSVGDARPFGNRIEGGYIGAGTFCKIKDLSGMDTREIPPRGLKRRQSVSSGQRNTRKKSENVGLPFGGVVYRPREVSDLVRPDEYSDRRRFGGWIQGECIGAGAFGKVYKCFPSNDTFGRPCAVKIVKIEPQYTETQQEVKFLKNEIHILRTLKHRRILTYYDSKEEDNHLHLFMEYMAGGSLSDHIKERKFLYQWKSRNYTRQILEGVSFLHSKDIIHRDIKGSNVLLDGQGNIKLADFGLSKIIQKIGSKTNLVSHCGTPYWMAPEIFWGEGYGRKADIWSVGCTVVEMLTGSPPLGHLEPAAAIFRIGSRPTEPTLPERVSQDAKDFIKVALKWNPKERPWSNELLMHSWCRSFQWLFANH